MDETMTLQQLIDALQKIGKEIGTLDVPVTCEDDCDIMEVQASFSFDAKGNRTTRVTLY